MTTSWQAITSQLSWMRIINGSVAQMVIADDELREAVTLEEARKLIDDLCQSAATCFEAEWRRQHLEEKP